MFNEFERREEWLDFSRLGVDFVLKHGFREDGRIYYALRRDGRPLREPWIYHAELSNLIAMAELARATRDESLYQKARSIFELAWKGLHDPNPSPASPFSQWEPTRVHGNSMITINVLQILRSYREEPTDRPRILECIDNMRRFHFRPERRLLLEFTGWNGEILDGSHGRRVNPGHMILERKMESGRLAQDTGRMRFASSTRSTNKVQLGILQTASTSVFYATFSLSIFLSRINSFSKSCCGIRPAPLAIPISVRMEIFGGDKNMPPMEWRLTKG
jgi:mannose/cellobiose epimerase-like protein (N-acyl-D-glucosamine 2-epimerase family)